jgi:hypothetical protein
MPWKCGSTIRRPENAESFGGFVSDKRILYVIAIIYRLQRKDRPNTFTYPFKEEEADSPAPRSAETSGAGATPTGRSSSSSSSSSGTSGEAFDFDSPVPKFFKKYAGAFSDSRSHTSGIVTCSH